MRSRMRQALLSRYYEIELSQQSVTGLLNVQEQRLIEDPIGVILCDARKKELSGDQLSVRRLHFDVDVLGPARIQSRHDGGQLVMPVCIGKLVPAQGVAAIVIVAI